MRQTIGGRSRRLIMPGLSADLVISGGKIITVNPRDDVAEAVAVFRDRIVAVGTADAIAPLIGNNTQVISLKGQTVLPGFIEPHTHFMLYGVWLSWVDAKTPPNKNIPQLLKRLRKKADETPKGEWIQAYIAQAIAALSIAGPFSWLE
jgi:predicted amidohydrolase YtcJ